MATALLTRVGLPAAPLLSAVLAGIVFSSVTRDVLTIPYPVLRVAQAIIGVTVGSLIHSEALQILIEQWLLVLVFSMVTILLSIALGVGFSRMGRIDSTTAAFGMIPGGASGIVAVSDELGADDRLVAFLQYLRIVVIVTSVPLIAATVFGANAPKANDGSLSAHAWIMGALALGACGLGLLLARIVQFPTGAILMPMLVATAIGTIHDPGVGVPLAVQDLALAVIGIHVGLRFTSSTLRTAGRLLPLALVTTVIMIAVSALLGIMLARLANVGDLAGYLGTSPGGLPVVLGITTDTLTDADATFVVMLQVLRVSLVLLTAPLIARYLMGRLDVDAIAENGGEIERDQSSTAYCNLKRRIPGG